MTITGYESTTVILQEIGQRLKDIRISIPMTQKELAERAGVSLRTITSLENGAEVQTGTLLNVLRALGLLTGINAMIPEQTARPSDIMQLGKKRERASSRQKETSASRPGWKWGDES